MKKKKFVDFFKSTKRQKSNQRKLYKELILLSGIIFLTKGISEIYQFDNKFYIGMGLLLFIVGVLAPSR